MKRTESGEWSWRSVLYRIWKERGGGRLEGMAGGGEKVFRKKEKFYRLRNCGGYNKKNGQLEEDGVWIEGNGGELVRYGLDTGKLIMDRISKELAQSDMIDEEEINVNRKDSPMNDRNQLVDFISKRELKKELSIKVIERNLSDEMEDNNKERIRKANEIARDVCVCEKPYSRCFGSVRPSELKDLRSLVRVLSVCNSVGSKWLSRKRRAIVRGGGWMEYEWIDPMEINWRELRNRMEEQERKDEENIELDPETHMVRAGDIYAIVRWFVRRWRGREKTLQFLHAYHVHMDHLTLLRELVALYLVPVGRSKELKYHCPKMRRALEKGRSHICRSIRRRVLLILADWITFRYGPIYRFDDRKSFNFLFKFISKLHPKNSEPLFKALQMALQQSLQLALLHSLSNISPNSLNCYNLSILDFSPSVIAQHITMIHQTLISHLSLDDFLCITSSSPLSRLIRRFNFLSTWICTQVLRPRSSPKYRSSVISHFIYTMHHLLLLRNYDGIMMILSALNNCSLSRLRKSWMLLSSQSLSLLQVSSNLFARNSSLYRLFITFHPPPCIPVLETLLRDITLINENTSSIHSLPVNLHKLLLLGKSLQLASKPLIESYMLPINPHLEALISSSDYPSDRELYSRSLQLEPMHKQPRCIHMSSPKSLLLRVKGNKTLSDR